MFEFTHVKCTQEINLKHVSSTTPKQWICCKCIGSVLPFYAHDISVSDDECLINTSCEIINDDVHFQAFPGNEKQLKIMHINTQSMVSTFDSLLLTLKQYPFDVVCMSETWLKNNQLLLQHVTIPGQDIAMFFATGTT